MAELPAVVFLLAELARVEELAQAAGGDAWAVHGHPSDSVAVYDSRREPVVYDEGWPSDEQKQHIALHDPASVLRRVAADRQILAEHAAEGGCCRVCADTKSVDYMDFGGYGFGMEAVPLSWPCRTVLLIAEAWGWEGTT